MYTPIKQPIEINLLRALVFQIVEVSFDTVMQSCLQLSSIRNTSANINEFNRCYDAPSYHRNKR